MKKHNGASWLFGLLGVLLAAAVLLICLTQRDASPRLFGKTEEAEECVRAMMTRICQGDYSGASAYLYGTPSLGTDDSPEEPVADMIWEAFVSSLSFSPQGGCYATVSGLAQDITVSGLDLPGVTQALKQHSPAVLEARVEAEEDMGAVYDENHQYREAFTQSVLEEAASQVLSSSASVERRVTVRLVYEENRWWVVPDAALLNAVSGGIISN